LSAAYNESVGYQLVAATNFMSLVVWLLGFIVMRIFEQDERQHGKLIE
jgi:hypothetical protein